MFDGWTFEQAKVVDSISILTFSGPGAPDPDLLGFVLRLSVQDGVLELQSCDTCKRTEPILQTRRILELDNCDTCTRTEPIIRN